MIHRNVFRDIETDVNNTKSWKFQLRSILVDRIRIAIEKAQHPEAPKY